MAKDFSRYNYDDAVNLLGAKVQLPKEGTRFYPIPSLLRGLTSSTTDRNYRRTFWAITASEMFAGDMWLGGNGFIGQKPPAGLPGHASILADIEAGFVSENVIKEVVNTHVGGILGREPSWSFLPEGATATAAERDTETGDTLTPWWNKRKALKDLQKTLRIALCEGIAVRRIFIPRAVNGQPVPPGSTITATDISSALEVIHFETVESDRGGVFTDPDTRQDIGVFLYEEHDSNNDVKRQCAELSFLNERGETVCKVVRDDNTTDTYGPYRLGGHLLIYELQLEQMITEQVQSSQKSVNLAHTMMMRNINLAGAQGINVLNAQPPSGPTTDKPTVTSDTTKIDGKFPANFKRGPGAVNFVMGVPYYSEDGQTIVGYTDPNVNIMEPVVVDSFQKTISEEKEAIYSQCHQRHVLIVDKADTSGRAREVARKEYERSLKASKVELDACGRWQLEATLRLAAQISNQTSKYAKLRADFNCLVDAGVPDPAFIQQVIAMRQPQGPKLYPIISDETARNLCGVEDPAAELARILQEGTQPPASPQPMPGTEPDTPPVTTGAVN
jgi:hypothetical protein